MLIRFLSHLVGLDIPWLVDDFFGEFLLLVTMFVLFAWVWFGYTGIRKNFLNFLGYISVLWGVLEINDLMGWLPFQHANFLEWNFVVFGVVILITDLRLKPFQLPLLAIIYLSLSWLATPGI